MKKIIVAIDIQKEYITANRPFYIKNIEPSLKNAKQIMQYARENNIPLLHVQHFRKSDEDTVFSQRNEFSEFITEYTPQKEEKIFIKNHFSSFSSKEFADEISKLNPEEIIIIGYGSSMCCLCTIIDGIHRGYQFTLIEDATASRAFPYADSQVMHDAAINILKQYAKVVKTDELLN